MTIGYGNVYELKLNISTSEELYGRLKHVILKYEDIEP
jgi:hypothetical protein